jgi:hypothetical protein
MSTTMQVRCPNCRELVPVEIVQSVTGVRADVAHRCEGFTDADRADMEFEALDRVTANWTW